MRALGITDGSAGMVAQVRALAEAMNVPIEMHAVKVNPLWRLLPNAAFDRGLAKIFPVTNQRFDALPEIIISCGRKGALVSASLRAQAKQSKLDRHNSLSLSMTKFIHIQDPQMVPAHFDVVVAMKHDKVEGANVIKTPYALHSITPEKLEAARAHWQPKFEHLPRPWNAVLIGGSTNKYCFTEDAMCALLTELDEIEGALLITTSRRTGKKNIRLLSDYFLHSKEVFLYTGELENPYLGLLACADKIYVTNDSVNMMSEALATGKSVSILPLLGHENTKPARFSVHIHELKISPQEMMRSLASEVKSRLL